MKTMLVYSVVYRSIQLYTRDSVCLEMQLTIPTVVMLLSAFRLHRQRLGRRLFEELRLLSTAPMKHEKAKRKPFAVAKPFGISRIAGVAEIVSNKKALPILNLISSLDTELKTHATADLDGIVSKLRSFNAEKITIPSKFITSAIDICAQRHDPLRIELLLTICKDNFDLFYSNPQLTSRFHFELATVIRSENGYDPYSKVVSYAISKLMRCGAVDSAMQLWARMDYLNAEPSHSPHSIDNIRRRKSTVGFVTNVDTMNQILSHLSVHPLPLSTIERVHDAFVSNCWNNNVSEYYCGLLCSLDKHLQQYLVSVYCPETHGKPDKDLTFNGLVTISNFIIPALGKLRAWTNEAEVLLSQNSSATDSSAGSYFARKLHCYQTMHAMIRRIIRDSGNENDSAEVRNLLSTLEIEMADSFQRLSVVSNVNQRYADIASFSNLIEEICNSIKDSLDIGSTASLAISSASHSAGNEAPTRESLFPYEMLGRHVTFLLSIGNDKEAVVALDELLKCMVGSQPLRSNEQQSVSKLSDLSDYLQKAHHNQSLMTTTTSSRAKFSRDGGYDAFGRTSNYLSALISEVIKAYNSNQNRTFQEIFDFASLLKLKADSYSIPLTGEFYAAWILSLYQSGGNYTAVDDNANESTVHNSPEISMDNLLRQVFTIVDSVDPEIKKSTTVIIDAIIELLTKHKNDGDIESAVRNHRLGLIALNRASTLALRMAESNSDQISLSSFARILKTAALLMNAVDLQVLVEKIDSVVDYSPVVSPMVSVAEQRDVAPIHAEIHNIFHGIVGGSHSDSKLLKGDDQRNSKRNRKTFGHVQPQRHEEFLTALLAAHSRLCNGLTCLQIMQQLRECSNCHDNSHAMYHTVLSALFHWKPVSRREWNVSLKASQIVQYFLLTMKKDEVFVNPKTVELLLKLFGKAAHTSRLRGIQGDNDYSSDAQEFVFNVCSSHKRDEKSVFGKLNDREFSGHPKCPITIEIMSELIKVCYMDGNTALAERLVADFTENLEIYLSPESISLKYATARLYEPAVFYHANIYGHLEAAEDVIIKHVTNKGYVPTTNMIDIFVSSWVRSKVMSANPEIKRFSAQNLISSNDWVSANSEENTYGSHLQRIEQNQEEVLPASSAENIDIIDWIQENYTQYNIRPSPATLRRVLELFLDNKDIGESKRVVCLIDQLYTPQERDSSIAVDSLHVRMNKNHVTNRYIISDENFSKSNKEPTRIKWVSANPNIQSLLKKELQKADNGSNSKTNSKNFLGLGLQGGFWDAEGVHIGALSNASLEKLYEKYGLKREML